MLKTSIALLLLLASSFGFTPIVRMATRRSSMMDMTPKIRQTPQLFYANNSTETAAAKDKPPTDDPSLEADELYVQFNSVASQDVVDAVLDEEQEDKEQEEQDIESNLDQVKITDSKHPYRDKTMNVISSERKLQTWLHAQHLDSSDDFYPEGIPMDVVVERLGDTLEDVATHVRRKGYENGKMILTKEQEESRKTVVVLGSGWGAHALMKVADCQKLRLIVVSPVNHFVFTPMLASSAVGTVEYRSMTEAVRSANPLMDDYLQGSAVGVDVRKKTVQVQMNSLLGDVTHGDPPTLEVPYDYLVCSVGCKINDWGVPGADKALRLKTLDDARILRRDIAECLEFASRPDVAPEERTRRVTFLIVGGGPTGVELAGEILDLAADVTKFKGSYPHLKDSIRVVIAQGGSDLVPQFEPKLREEAKKSLEAKGAEVLMNTRVTEVGDGFAKLKTKVFDADGNVVGGEESTLPLGLTAWCAGTAPVPFVETLLEQLPPEARNRDGRVKVDQWLRPLMPSEDLTGSVYVIGDAAAFADQGFGASADSPLPQTAQVAGQQGAFLARLLDRGYDVSATPPMLLPATAGNSNSTAIDVFNDPQMRAWLELRGLDQAPGFIFLNLGILAYLGGGEALSQVQLGDFPLFSYFGSVAFLLWRSVYLVKQVATRNRVLVTFDWMKSFVFGRDMTRF
ncbi:unnamed protein product [Cylindrotheca closterium]|uniref:FAD/NAD(P)-binding domain-containing protein n=1 Tax=Cylindrotheca closterium TaxID=2856 RepID=A0AAD2CL77_9STRA|nr:unnamed protein product [Cylindrotheca closterium]